MPYESLTAHRVLLGRDHIAATSAAALILSLAMLTMHTRAGPRAVAYLFSDRLSVCTCGSQDVTFRPAQGPPGSVHLHYAATCEQCSREWRVLDVDWNDPRKVIDATLQAVAPDLPLDE